MQPSTSNPPTLRVVHPDIWQPLPARGRLLFRLRHALGFALLATIVLTPLLGLAGTQLAWPLPYPLIAIPVGCALLGAAFGAWLGGRRHSYYRWRLDDTGFAVKSGKLWQSHVHVPATRVQHLDIKRGPLERQRHLATLTVHTAGSFGHAITLPCLDAANAEALRAELARRIEPESDAD